jgi:hypothetical protein
MSSLNAKAIGNDGICSRLRGPVNDDHAGLSASGPFLDARAQPRIMARGSPMSIATCVNNDCIG